MAHFPVNHPARPLYRVFAGLVGVYILVFGVFGVVQTWGEPLFSRGSHWALGLRTNLAFSLVILPVLILGAAGGFFSIALVVTVHEAAELLTVANGLRAARA